MSAAPVLEPVTLYFCPLTCARIAMTALEQAGVTYDVLLVNLMADEQKSPEYLALNPAGKVPALKVGERVLTENAAIALYLDGLFPEAGLLPKSDDPLTVGRARADLIWCSTTLHPIVRQVRAPYHYTTGDQEPVKAKGAEAATAMAAQLERRLGESPWWFGDAWSIVDSYLAWVVAGCAGALDLAAYPAVVSHGARVAGEACFKRMFDREGAEMAAAGIQLPPGMSR